jgi:hypothetical protein
LRVKRADLACSAGNLDDFSRCGHFLVVHGTCRHPGDDQPTHYSNGCLDHRPGACALRLDHHHNVDHLDTPGIHTRSRTWAF